MDYREALLNLNEVDLKYIYEQLLHESAADLHSIEMIESIRHKVLTKEYLERTLQVMPSDEYDLFMQAVQAGHEFIPVPESRVFFSLQSLLMFETKQGMIIPFDLADEIKTLNKNNIEAERQQLEQDLLFMTGALFLYGYVHRQHLDKMYRHYFNEALSEKRLVHIITLLGIEPLEDLIVLPVIHEGFTGQTLPDYDVSHYYMPESFEELKQYAGADHHCNEEALNALLDFVGEHSEDNTDELLDTVRFLVIASNDANLTMEEMIKLFAKNLSTPEFEMFERLFIKALEETRLWIYGGKKLGEMKEEIQHQEQIEENEKEKKVINLEVFRKG
ncbi:hypothetical protein ERX37_09825 [Macrococcus hajekii]|uniref:Uncharacterized protein n=1 Tax=Macrococcus hajekii TaxID=198482 RepID=A0A4R6BHV0_9STAP|nr:hypothetical protein [Macrococcus hajekii]TDM01170.1 hypothetical protein ERX37_09825 [Macrococcus hajekii]GGB11985.1 hypothetical protein GCM10007190_20060 [Macrococcus hajekii]